MDKQNDIKWVIDSVLKMIDEIEKIVKNSRVSLEATYKPPPKKSSGVLIDTVAEDITIRGKRSYNVEYCPGRNVVRNNYGGRGLFDNTTAAIVTDAESGRIFLVKVEEVVRKQ